MSKKAQAKRFIGELTRIAADTYNSLFSRDQLQQVSDGRSSFPPAFLLFLLPLYVQGR